tara:strand:- start:100 stop:294 length:195 start_codon:yes stop_codon:yes gene_type:complete
MGTIIPTDCLAPNISAIIRTLTIAKPGNPVLENPRLKAPNSTINQLVVEMSLRGFKINLSEIRV